jgi:SpoIIAA-like
MSMIESIGDLPDGVLGFHMHGRIEKADYTDVLLPALHAEIGAERPIRILVRFGPDLEGFEPAALWEDLKAGVSNELRHRDSWKRMALVTDLDWVTRAASLFGWAAPGDLKLFRPAEEPAAAEWVAGG